MHDGRCGSDRRVNTPRGRADRAKAHAFAAGFDLAGVATLGAVETAPQFREWLAAGYHGEMAWLDRSATLRDDTTRPEPGMRSAIVVALDYGGKQPAGSIARYARGADYHDVMREMLRNVHHAMVGETGEPFAARPYVDTGPVLERDLARRAGLGWFGKNTMLINPERGSFFFIGALFVALDLEPDAPFEADRCGTCTRCLDACPTDAFTAPRVLDATRCISYLTIEHRTAIPSALRPLTTELIFGCDVCQDVCPWNVRFASEPRPGPLAPQQERTAPDLGALLLQDNATSRAGFRGSAITRARRRGLARNIAVALGNRRDPRDLPALRAALLSDPEPLVRAHAAWALGRFHDDVSANDTLRTALAREPDAEVRAEIHAALTPQA